MLAPLPISSCRGGARSARLCPSPRVSPPAFAYRRATLLRSGVASAHPPFFVIPNEVRDLLFLPPVVYSQPVGKGTAAISELLRFRFSNFQFPLLSLHKHRHPRPAQNCPDDQRNHRNRRQIQQPISNAGIEQRRRIIRITLFSMEKMSVEETIGNMRHSHDNLLAQAACAAHSQAIEGTWPRLYSPAASMSRPTVCRHLAPRSLPVAIAAPPQPGRTTRLSFRPERADAFSSRSLAANASARVVENSAPSGVLCAMKPLFVLS